MFPAFIGDDTPLNTTVPLLETSLDLPDGHDDGASEGRDESKVEGFNEGADDRE